MSAYVQTVVGSDSPPVGAVMDFAGNVEPSGWLFCFGQSLPRTGIYAQLFQVIGTLYGAVDGSSFSLPDWRGRVSAGRDDMGGAAANRLTSAWGVDGVTLGANGGNQSHQLTVAQLAAHTHTEMRTSATAGGQLASGTYGVVGFVQNTGSTGGDEAHPNVQPTFIVNKIIKYTVSGTVLPIVPGEGDVVGPDGGVADGDLAVFAGTSGKLIRSRGSSLLPKGYISGLGIANGTDATNDIDIAPGIARDSTDVEDIKLPAGITKQLDVAWAAGTNQGGRDTGAIADAWWHVFVIKNQATGVVDALFSQSATAPTLPSGYTALRRVGSVMRNAAALLNFVQLGDTFTMPSVSVYSTTTARSFAAFTMTRCPLGIITFPIMKVQVVSNGAAVVYFTFGQGLDSTIQIGLIPQVNTTNNVDTVIISELATNLSQQIYFSVSGTTIAAALINQHGYLDNRGKDDYSP